MLSRIANNLYWAGRNLERMEHIARFVPVNYFASLDAPIEIDTQTVLRTINSMAGSLPADNSILVESEVLNNIAFDTANSSSLISCANLVRENLKGTRFFISTELWESVNALYHFIDSFDKSKYLKTSMSEFLIKVLNHVSICKQRIDSSLLHNQGWSILKIGLTLERSFQITRIIQLKLTDVLLLEESMPELVPNEFGNLLKSLEGFDMNIKFYQKPVNKQQALEFLIFNETFPRSLAFCFNEFAERIDDLSLDQKGKSESVKLIARNLRNELAYSIYDDIETSQFDYVTDIQVSIINMNEILVSKYFSQT